MKMKLLTTAAVVALATVLAAPAAKAQTFTAGDIILGFADPVSTDQGSSTNVEIDLGSLSTYTSFSGGSPLQLTNLNTDLGNVYGTSYFSNSNLQFALLGASSSGALTKQILVSTTSGTPYAGGSAAGSNTLGTQVAAYQTIYTPNQDTSNPPVAGATTGAYKIPTANVYSLSNTVNSNGIVNSYPNFYGNFTGSTTSLSLNMLNSTGHLAGTSAILTTGSFFITSNGEVQFGAQQSSAPEPSTYALVVLGGLLLCWQINRRKVTSL